MAEEKLWKDCSKEEHKAVNTISRCYRYFYGSYIDKKIKKKEWMFYKSKCLYALDLSEWYYSKEETEQRDFRNWRESIEMYQQVRDML